VGAEGHAAQHEGRHENQDDQDHKSKRQARHVAAAQEQEGLVVDQGALEVRPGRAGAVQRQGDAPVGVQPRQGDDERGHLEHGGDHAVEHACRRAGGHRDHDREQWLHPDQTDQVVREDPGEQQHRADRQVEPAAQQHEHLPEGDDPDH
jgi:hypothetical protein